MPPSSGVVGNNEGFTGHIEDTALHLNYMQARMYDPVVGRFLSNDPVSFMGSGGDPRFFNRDAYVRNDLINRIDPDRRNSNIADPQFQRDHLSPAEQASFMNGETTASGSIGGSVGAKASGSVVGGLREATREGNSINGEIRAEINVDSFTGQVGPFEGSLGGVTIPLFSTNPDASLDPVANGPDLQLKNPGLDIGTGITTDIVGEGDITINISDTADAFNDFASSVASAVTRGVECVSDVARGGGGC
ncbi:MAG: RHS repeat-associated core domain-containing protein [Pseudomonadota bacterium]